MAQATHSTGSTEFPRADSKKVITGANLGASSGLAPTAAKLSPDQNSERAGLYTDHAAGGQNSRAVAPLEDPELPFGDRCQITLRVLEATYTQVGKQFIELYKNCLGSHSDGRVFEKETQFPLSYLSEACKHMRSLFSEQWPDVQVDPALEGSVDSPALRSLRFAAKSIAGNLTTKELAIADVTHTVVRLYCSDQVTRPYVSFLNSSVFTRYVSDEASKNTAPLAVNIVRFNAKVLFRLAEAYLTACLAGDPRDMEATMQVLETLRLFLTRTRDPLEYIIRNIHNTHKREASELCALTFSVFIIDCSV